MAYSNTKRDKKQLWDTRGLRNGVIAGILVLVTTSSLLNIYRQWTTLNAARTRNSDLSIKIGRISNENRILQNQIREATKSANIDRKQREYFGLGSPDDVWLLLPPDAGNAGIGLEVTQAETLPNVIKWWNLFTK